MTISIETATHYHVPTLPLSAFSALLTHITNQPLTGSLLTTHSTQFTAWVLTRIQQCLESMTELYIEDIEILVPLLSFETNKYGSTLLDRFLPILERRILRNPSIAVEFVDRVVQGVEKGEVSTQGRDQIQEAVKTSLSLMFFRDDRLDVEGEEEEESNERPSTARSSTRTNPFTPTKPTPTSTSKTNTSPSSKSHPPRPLPLTLCLPPQRIPKVTGAALAHFFTRSYLLASQPDAVRSILWNMQMSLPTHTFADFLRTHLPLLQHLLPILPQHGIDYTDMVLQKYVHGVLYKVLHDHMWTEPPLRHESGATMLRDPLPLPPATTATSPYNDHLPSSDDAAHDLWTTRARKVQRAFVRLDQVALRAILGDKYAEFAALANGSMPRDRRPGRGLNDIPVPSVERDERHPLSPVRWGDTASSGVGSSPSPLGGQVALPPPWLVRSGEAKGTGTASPARSDGRGWSGGEERRW